MPKTSLAIIAATLVLPLITLIAYIYMKTRPPVTAPGANVFKATSRPRLATRPSGTRPAGGSSLRYLKPAAEFGRPPSAGLAAKSAPRTTKKAPQAPPPAEKTSLQAVERRMLAPWANLGGFSSLPGLERPRPKAAESRSRPVKPNRSIPPTSLKRARTAKNNGGETLPATGENIRGGVVDMNSLQSRPQESIRRKERGGGPIEDVSNDVGR